MPDSSVEKYRAYICFGPNCGPKGTSGLLDFLTDLVIARGLEATVRVSATGCQGHCDSGPTMVVYPGPVFYQDVNPERLERILQEHFEADQPVKDFFWKGGRTSRGQLGAFDVGSRRPPRVEDHSPRRKQSRPKRSPEDVDDFKW